MRFEVPHIVVDGGRLTLEFAPQVGQPLEELLQDVERRLLGLLAEVAQQVGELLCRLLMAGVMNWKRRMKLSSSSMGTSGGNPKLPILNISTAVSMLSCDCRSGRVGSQRSDGTR